MPVPKTTVFAVVALLVGVAMLAAGVHGVSRSRAVVERYEPVEARIVRSEYASRLPFSRRPVVEYRYRVDGQEYAGNTVYPGLMTSKHAGSLDTRINRTAVDRYREGDRATVYCDPDDPERAALERDENLWYLYLTMVVAGVALLAVGAAMPFLDLSAEETAGAALVGGVDGQRR